MIEEAHEMLLTLNYPKTKYLSRLVQSMELVIFYIILLLTWKW